MQQSKGQDQAASAPVERGIVRVLGHGAGWTGHALAQSSMLVFHCLHAHSHFSLQAQLGSLALAAQGRMHSAPVSLKGPWADKLTTRSKLALLSGCKQARTASTTLLAIPADIYWSCT